ncbi:hypothetical protein DFH29DRAFT_938859 [Suillus ampliporus]|nr:hypothetical protein DFH29DRAFT_938859 [Suillus ampliporus]
MFRLRQMVGHSPLLLVSTFTLISERSTHVGPGDRSIYAIVHSRNAVINHTWNRVTPRGSRNNIGAVVSGFW